MNNTINEIKTSEVYKQIMSDSFGGIMYDVDNRNKYDDSNIIALWDSLTEQERGAQDGIITGAMHFITEDVE